MPETAPIENETLRDSLERWLEVVRHMLRQGRPPRGIDDQGYVRLHQDLLAAMKSERDSSDAQQWHQTLHQAVRPWVNLDSLRQCDKKILRLLEQEVSLLLQQLVPRRQWGAKLLCATIVTLLVAVVITGFISAGEESVFASSVDQVLQHLRGLRAQVWVNVTQSSMNQKLTVLAGTMVVAGMFFLRDAKRF
jgi:hypothetical protein